jgi:hypothetical protein
MSRKRLAVLALAATTLAASGCGGSSKASTSLSKAELIAKADTICARVHAQYHANGYSTTQSIARLAPRVAAYEHAGVAEMRKLSPPASMASDWKQILDAAQRIADDTAKLGQYAKENNVKAEIPLYTADRPRQQQALAIATRDGFKECAKVG